jgi:hypothetical protein
MSKAIKLFGQPLGEGLGRVKDGLGFTRRINNTKSQYGVMICPGWLRFQATSTQAYLRLCADYILTLFFDFVVLPRTLLRSGCIRRLLYFRKWLRYSKREAQAKAEDMSKKAEAPRAERS